MNQQWSMFLPVLFNCKQELDLLKQQMDTRFTWYLELVQNWLIGLLKLSGKVPLFTPGLQSNYAITFSALKQPRITLGILGKNDFFSLYSNSCCQPMFLDSFPQSIISFNQHSNIMRKRIIIPSYKCRNSDSEHKCGQ